MRLNYKNIFLLNAIMVIYDLKKNCSFKEAENVTNWKIFIDSIRSI